MQIKMEIKRNYAIIKYEKSYIARSILVIKKKLSYVYTPPFWQVLSD